MALKNVSILFVEDDPVFRSLLSSFLEIRGAHVLQAKDGEAGLSYLAQQGVDVILADLNMPNLSGLEMLKTISQAYPHIPSIVMSGSPVMSDVLDALRHGASDYLVKPISDLYLVENAIRECLESQLDSAVQSADLEAFSYLELQQHLHLLEQDKQAAKQVQQQLLPPTPVDYQQAQINYSLFNDGQLSAHFIDTAMVDEEHIMLYMAQFYPQDHHVAFASILVKSFVNHELKRYRNQLSDTMIKPAEMLAYLNERISQAGLGIYADMIYVIVSVANRKLAIAQSGSALRCYLRNEEGLTAIALSDSLQLGVLNWGQVNVHQRRLQTNERLCIMTHIPEHRAYLLNDKFYGLRHKETIAKGGYIQLSLY